MKKFYKKINKPKLFFAKTLKFRTTAYGAAVLDAHMAWVRYFYKQWNAQEGCFLLSAQGDPGGNPVRSDGVSFRIRIADTVQTRKSNSALPPLLYRSYFFEVDGVGNLLVNGAPCGQTIGLNLKAWAFFTLPQEDSDKKYLLVIGTPDNAEHGTYLSTYEFDEMRGKLIGRRQNVLLSDRQVAYDSALVCFGRHIVCILDGKLHCFYLSPETELLEEVPIGTGTSEEHLRNICCNAVADGAGNIFWTSGDEVYGFRVGDPSRLLHIRSVKDCETVRLACMGPFLFIYRRDHEDRLLCEAYRTDEAEPERAGMRFGPGDNLVLGARGSMLTYVKLHEGDFSLCENSGEERKTFLGSGGPAAAFCLFGALIADARYAYFNEARNIVILKR